ncbi:hypothetical protein G3580_12120 [Nitrogeniibacter mangrovi]|uniref:Uncharacterized protein n=2 Tax=Nitrogeniibacter mangrovi TaxID=2016596 RepID=A0A6C1BAV1_9RHOO|nr:hypothetical protein G3580_12120 [Nitrogeniibacter mangrovi]
MNDRTLVRKLALVVAIKLAAIFALWWVFVRDDRIVPAADMVAEHIGQRSDSPSQGHSHGQ